jgi:hypothetical protein
MSSFPTRLCSSRTAMTRPWSSSGTSAARRCSSAYQRVISAGSSGGAGFFDNEFLTVVPVLRNPGKRLNLAIFIDCVNPRDPPFLKRPSRLVTFPSTCARFNMTQATTTGLWYSLGMMPNRWADLAICGLLGALKACAIASRLPSFWAVKISKLYRYPVHDAPGCRVNSPLGRALSSFFQNLD